MQPNILLICDDQHRYDCLGINGHKSLRTPNLDRLATEGVRFENAFTPCPVCTPSRVSMLTGQWSFKHGMLSIPEWTELSMINWEPEHPSFPRELKNAGYYLGHVGKWHSDCEPHKNANPSPYDIGFDDFIPESDYHVYCVKNNIRSMHYEPVESTVPWDKWKSKVDEFVGSDESRLNWGAGKVVDLIEKHSSGKPFFIRWDPTEPHLPNVVPRDYADKYPVKDIELWGSCADTLDNKSYALRQYALSWGIENLSDDEIKSVISLYLANIELLDKQVGRLLDTLESQGLTQNTLVIFTSDHGDTCGSHRLIDKHFTMYDDITHVPLIMRWPGMLQAGQVRSDFVSSSVDLATTILSAADVAVPSTFQGMSLLEDTGREDIISAYHGGNIGLFTQRMLRNKKWKYVYNATDRDELYNLEKDPWEMNNLIYNEDDSEIVRQMRLRLAEWLESAGDRLIESPWIQSQLCHNRKL
ncbi:MAG: sulfatase-like hydrolase/transferase [Saccharofermentanales bacterium]